MQNLFGLIAIPPGPALSTHRERSNLIIFAFLAAVLAALSVFHVRLQLEAAALETRVSLLLGAVAMGEPGQGDRKAPPLEAVGDPRLRALAAHLSRRYLVSEKAMENLVTAAHETGRSEGLDPLLILAVMGVESGFNPLAESVAGAKGLMQVIPKYHWEKFPDDGEQAVLDPRNNIAAGARILKEYLRHTGDLVTALQKYAGAIDDPIGVYSSKVLAEQQRLQRVVRQVKA